MLLNSYIWLGNTKITINLNLRPITQVVLYKTLIPKYLFNNNLVATSIIYCPLISNWWLIGYKGSVISI